MKNNKVIAPGMFRINLFKTSRVENFVLNKPVKASVRTKLINTLQPHVITKKDVNSDLHGLSSTCIDNTAKTRRPQPRSNIKNDRLISASKSRCVKNKEVEVEEHHRNLLISKNKKHMSFECNNIMLAIQNDKSEVVCAMQSWWKEKKREQEKQKVKDDREKAELKQLMETILDKEEVAIDAISLAVKSSRIVDWKIHKEGKKSYYKIVRADGKSQMYMIFSQMLKSFDMEDLKDLYNLVKARYGSTRPIENMDYLLWSDMKIMFEPHIEDEI
nr:hypothetical protein [Tanacetum cinerariifolium]